MSWLYWHARVPLQELSPILPVLNSQACSPVQEKSSAPETPMMGRKLLVTTAIATVLWVIAYLIIESDWISFRQA